MNNDYLIRFITEDGAMRGAVAITTKTVQELVRRHDMYPTAAVAFGRALTGCALMSGLLKSGRRISLKFEGNGELRKIFVEGDSNGGLRGSVAEPHVNSMKENGDFDVASAIGKAGFLTVTQLTGNQAPYSGTVQLLTSEVGEDIAHYLSESEQIPSAIGLAINAGSEGITSSGGFLIQALPPLNEETIETVAKRVENLPPLSDILSQLKTPENVLAMLLDGIKYQILEVRNLYFHCGCSRDKVAAALLTLSSEELQELSFQEESQEVVCEFCKESYFFTAPEIGEIAESKVHTAIS